MATSKLPDLSTFPYGMRFVKRVRDDGAVVVEPVPLTLEEALVPQEGDQVPESTLHDQWRSYLRDVFRLRLADDPTVAVLSDVRVEWGRPDVPAYSPDVAVMRGVTAHRDWRTFDVTEEGARPVLVVEITSPTTANADRTDKRAAYARAAVACYILIDTIGRRGRPDVRLIGYRLGPAGFEPLVPDARGWLWLEAVGVWLGLEGGRPRCYDQAGQPIPDFVEQAAQNAEQAARIAEQAARIAALEAELRRLRGGSSG